MIFEAFKQVDPAKVALQDETGSLCYGELEREIANRQLALEEVAVLGIALDNSMDAVLWDLAAIRANIPCVPLPPFFTQQQVAHSLQSAGVTHLLTVEGLQPTGIKATDALPQGTHKVTYTSGTTGQPKGVCLPQEAMDRVASNIVSALGQEFVGNHVSVLPMAVLLENVAGIYAGLMAGCSIQLSSLTQFGDKYQQLYQILEAKKATSVILVPEILRLLMAQVAEHGPLPTLKFIAVGGSKIDPLLIAQARALGLPVYEGYGLSECASVVSLNTTNDSKSGTVGKLLPHVNAELIDGEIHIKNPGFLGYVGATPIANFATGDLGTIDEDGYLSVTGRRKNVLITSYGRNVSPEWVESVLLTQPVIAQVIVYGDAQPHLSALIVPAAPQLDIQAAVAAANYTLPDYAQILDYQTVPPFTLSDNTLTGTGRPRRQTILQRYTSEHSDELLRSTR